MWNSAYKQYGQNNPQADGQTNSYIPQSLIESVIKQKQRNYVCLNRSSKPDFLCLSVKPRVYLSDCFD